MFGCASDARIRRSSPKALEEICRIETKTDELDRDVFPERVVRAAREMDGPHSAASDLLNELVRPDPGALRNRVEGAHGFAHAAVERGRFGLGEQRLDLFAQRGVIPAGLTEERVAVCVRQLDGLVEERSRFPEKLGRHAVAPLICRRSHASACR